MKSILNNNNRGTFFDMVFNYLDLYFFWWSIMKKLKPYFIAIFIGSICAVILFANTSNNAFAYEEYNAYAVQIGVFTKEEYAFNLKQKYNGKVVYDDGVYRVYFSILFDKENINFITDYLEKNNIGYITKRIYISSNAKEIKKYENIMKQMKSEKGKLKINEEILNMYEGVI